MGSSGKQVFSAEDLAAVELGDPDQLRKGGRVTFTVTEAPAFLKDNIEGPQIGDISVVCKVIGRLGGTQLFESGTGVLFQHNAESGSLAQVTEPDAYQFTHRSGSPVGEIGRRLIAEWNELEEFKQTIRESINQSVDAAFAAFASRRASVKKMNPPPSPLAE